MLADRTLLLCTLGIVAVSALGKLLLYRKMDSIERSANKLFNIAMAKQNGVDLPPDLF